MRRSQKTSNDLDESSRLDRCDTVCVSRARAVNADHLEGWAPTLEGSGSVWKVDIRKFQESRGLKSLVLNVSS